MPHGAVSDNTLEKLASGATAPLQKLPIPADTHDREQYIDQLFRSHYDKVARWCQRFANDRESAADLAQEVFTKAYQKLDSFQGRSSFSTWLYVIARNHCLNAVCRNVRPTHSEWDELYLERVPDPGDSPHTTLERASRRDFVARLLDESLNATEKTVFTLHYGEDVPLAVIDRLLGLQNRSGARAYIVSAKRKLKRTIQHRDAGRAKENVMVAA